MENFKRNVNGRPGRPKAIDGFIGGARQAKNAPNFKRPKSYLPDPSPVGGFNRKEGFHPYKQDQLASTQAATEPATPLGVGATDVDGPAIAEKKQSRFKRRKDKKAEKAKHQSKRRNWKKRLLWGGIIFLSLLVIIGGFLFAKGYLNFRKVFKGGAGDAPALNKNADPTKLNGEGDGRVNILLLGRGGDGHTAPDLTDTLLVASIDPINNEAALLSIPRDLWVRSGYSGTKINSVYANAKSVVLNGKKIPDQAKKAEEAGLKAITDTVSSTMGIPIHYHIMVDFKAFQEAIDTVGGIDVNVTTPLRDTLWLEDTGKIYTIDVKPGRQHFDGRKALVYARSRYTSQRGDFDRAERQRAIIIALKEKVLSAGTYSNPIKISQLMSTFGNHVVTNLSSNHVMRLYDISKLIDASKVTSVGLADPPNNYVKTANINGLSVVTPRVGNLDFSEIQAYVRNTLKDGYIKKENPSVMLLNGTQRAGLATTKANELKSYGYNVTQVADAPTKNYTKTILVDLRAGSKKYTKRYLEQRFKVTAVSSLPDPAINPGTADFVIILGQNESTTN